MIYSLFSFSRLSRYSGLLLLLLISFTVKAQNTSNKGTDFWVAYTGHVSGADNNPANRPQLKLYLTSDVNTSGMVEIPGQNFSQPFTITANSVTIVQVPHDLGYIGSSEIIENRGIHVTALKPIVVYSHIYRSAQSGATLVLPTNTLGRAYYSINYDQALGAGMVSQFTIVATEDNTSIEITPSQTTTGGQTSKFSPARPLMKGEVYQVQSQVDLSGSKIEAVSSSDGTCKKIAVFAGSTFTRINKGCPNGGTGDNLYQQLYPYSAWGKNFITAPFSNRTSGDVYRVLAGPENTVINVNGTSINLLAGAFYEFEGKTGNSIKADKPITLAQYPKTRNCDNLDGDPEMIILAPVEQTLNNITLYSSNQFNITGNYINVVMKSSNTASFRLDGSPVTFVPITVNPAYSYSQNKVQEGTHTLVADSGFAAIAYGFGNPESYGYSAGANVKDLTKFITPLPLAGPAYTTGCENTSVNLKITVPYNPTSLIWDFGDGTTFTETDLTKRISPDHIYASKGRYVVKATIGKPVSNDCDTQDEVTFDFDVQPNPEAIFNPVDFCAKNASVFQDQSVAATGTAIAKWEWNFGDGSPVVTSTDPATKSPSHIFANPGDYRVKLTITTTGGCTDTTSQKITVNPLPKPIFAVNPSCESQTVTFTNTSTILSGTIARYEWNFGDKSAADNTSIDVNPSHVYTQPGIYSVLLKLVSDKGCIDSLRKSVTIYPKPKAAFELPGVCFNDRIKFLNKSTISSVAGIPDSENNPLTYFWDFGNGTTSTVADPNPVYNAIGFYRVKLRVTSKFGCVDTTSTKFVVSSAEPKAEFAFTDLCQKDSVQFTDKSFIDFGNIIKWEWSFGDGQTSTEQNPKHLYATFGTFTVTLKAFSGQTCFDIKSKSITIIPSPTAIFSVTNVCLKENSRFTETSTMPAGIAITGYAWDFGDGSTSGERAPAYVYKKSGTYTVRLTVTAANGCTDQTTRQIIIYPEPVAAFSATSFCQKDAVVFKNNSLVSSGTLDKYSWDFGDGTSSNQADVTHQYATAGVKTVKLTVTTNFGCVNTTEQTIIISAVPQANAGQDQIGLCGVTSYVLKANNPPAGLGTWTVASGADGSFSNADQANATFTGQMNELYTLRWTVKNEPCPDAVSEVKIKFNPIPKVEAGTAPELVEGESYTLEGSGEGTYSWSPAAGLSSTTLPNPVATPLETTVYKLTVTSAAGCTATDSVLVKVLEKLKIPNAFSPNNDGVNDTWKIGGIQDYLRLTIDIFDRWGSKIYSGGYDKAWDGTRDGKPLPMATYYYIINPNNKRKTITGPISIVR